MKTKVERKKRAAARKKITPLSVDYVTSLDDFTKIARDCDVVEASATGLLLHIPRESLLPSKLRQNLTLDCLVGDRIFMRLEQMNLEISGIIARTQFMGKTGFMLAIDYTDDAPEYWRECLMDLLPSPGELD